jgi:hypothetical protein
MFILAKFSGNLPVTSELDKQTADFEESDIKGLRPSPKYSGSGKLL